MNKLINPTQEPQILKICYGNDFSLSVSVNVWNADTSAWDKLDLSAASDVELFLVAQNGKRIKTNTTLDESGDLTTQVPSTFLSKTIYSIEITFKLDGRNRRTYSPCLLQIVNSTEEAGRSVEEYVTNDAYHFDIMVKNDIAWLNIGALPSEYITDDELAYVLTSYATNASVENQINLLWQDCNSTFVDNDELSTALLSYATISYVSEAISEIPIQDLSAYVTKTVLDSTLSSYATSITDDGDRHGGGGIYYKDISLCNSQNTAISTISLPAFSYQWTSGTSWIAPNNDTGLIRRTDVKKLYDTYNNLNNVELRLLSYVTGGVYNDTDHTIDLKHDDTVVASIDASAFIVDGMIENVYISNGYLVIEFNTDAGKQDINIPISDIFDANNYYTKNDIDVTLSSYVTQSDMSAQSYVTSNALQQTLAIADYVSHYYLDNQSYATEAYVTDAIANIPTGGGDVTYEYLSEQSYVQATYWDSSNEAIAYELTNNRLEHMSINDNFSYYYTKTEADGRYATTSWANGKFVIKNDNENQNQAIAAAFASSVQSTTVHNIWTGSQNDYDAITTKDTNTLYVIL